MQDRSELIADQTLFEILGVAQDASDEAVHSAFLELAKIWHPDRIAADLADLKPEVAKIFARINDAYRTLSNPGRRKGYLELVQSGGGTARDQELVARVVDSAFLFQKGEILYKKGQTAEAENLVRQANEADPEQPEYRALLAWIQAERLGVPDPAAGELASTHYREQIAMLNEVLTKEPKFERALFYRAQLLKRSGELQLAMADFRKVAQINPRNIDAAREVRLFDRRKQRESKGLLGRLFGKDD